MRMTRKLRDRQIKRRDREIEREEKIEDHSHLGLAKTIYIDYPSYHKRTIYQHGTKEQY